MSRTSHALIVALLISLLTTPSWAQSQPLATGETARWRAVVQALEPAAFVSIRLSDGSKLKGTLVGADDATFLIKPRTRIAVPARELRYDSIVSLERATPGMSPGAKVLIGTGVGVGGFLILMLSVLATLD